MDNPYASPLADSVEKPAAASPGETRVRWNRPKLSAFCLIVSSWGCCTGFVLGIAAFVSSFFGGETRLDVYWHLEGVAAGAGMLIFLPLTFLVASMFIVMLYPVFRLFVALTRGPKLRFHQEFAKHLFLSRLSLGSYVKLSVMFGFLLGLFQSFIAFVLICASGSQVEISEVFPVFFHGTARLAWIVAATPFFFGFYSGVIAVFAFYPFRFLMRISNGFIFAYEFVPTETAGTRLNDIAKPQSLNP
jgi:hypothetical protein